MYRKHTIHSNVESLPSSPGLLDCSRGTCHWSRCRCHSNSTSSQGQMRSPWRLEWRSCGGASPWSYRVMGRARGAVGLLSPSLALSSCPSPLLCPFRIAGCWLPAGAASLCWSNWSPDLSSWWLFVLLCPIGGEIRSVSTSLFTLFWAWNGAGRIPSPMSSNTISHSCSSWCHLQDSKSTPEEDLHCTWKWYINKTRSSPRRYMNKRYAAFVVRKAWHLPLCYCTRPKASNSDNIWCWCHQICMNPVSAVKCLF